MKTVQFKRPDGKKMNIEIIKYHPNDLSRNKTPNRHRHDFHSIFLVLGGSSFQEIDFVDYELTKNQIMLIPKGAIHWEKEIKGLYGYTILFNDEFFSGPQNELLHGLLHYAIALRKLLIPLDEVETNQIELYLQLLLQEQEASENQNKTFILQNLMLALLNKLESLIQHMHESTSSFLKYRRPFQRFISSLNASYTDQNSLDHYAAELNITKRKLNEVVKEMTGQTANSFIIERVLLEAKRELCFGEKSIKEIALKLGYENQYYFSRIFKNKVGLGPEKFRAQFAE